MLIENQPSHLTYASRKHAHTHTRRGDNSSRPAARAVCYQARAAAATLLSLTYHIPHTHTNTHTHTHTHTHTGLEIPTVCKKAETIHSTLNSTCYFLPPALWNKCSCEAAERERDPLFTHAQPDRDTESTLHLPTEAPGASSVSLSLSASYIRGAGGGGGGGEDTHILNLLV